MLPNNSAPQSLSSVSWFSPEVVSYLSSGGRELYETAKQIMCFLKSLINVKNMGILPLMGQLKFKAHSIPPTIILRDFNNPHSLMDILKIQMKQRNSETKEVMDQMDLTNIYRTFHPKSKEYTFFSAPHGTFSKTDHIIGHKTDLKSYKKINDMPPIQ